MSNITVLAGSKRKGGNTDLLAGACGRLVEKAPELEDILGNNPGSRKFFINKVIGWSLC